MKFQNSYFEKLPQKFHQEVLPHKFASPTLAYLNEDLAKELKINLDKKELAEIFSGKKILPSSKPIALAYAGHQFGHFVPQLGDGRAVLLGEIDGFDIQLKGSGKTRFSRGGDGFMTLGAAIREYVVSEAMHYLDVPTTRALAIVATNEPVFREEVLPGAVLTRVAQSHIRVGTFEYFAARSDFESVKQLADYAIARHFPTCKTYEDFFKQVVKQQAKLIAKWLAIGFVHGVMNTDNMAISGETIDYGPCAFLDEYDAAKTFSSIDSRGRYAFTNQPNIAKWNLFSLANCLVKICEDEKKLIENLESFDEEFRKNYHKEMARKLGFKALEDVSILVDFLELLQKNQSDYTISFRKLSEALTKNPFGENFENWLKKWRAALQKENCDFAEIAKKLNKFNPFVIARNHSVETVIQSAVADNNFTPLEDFLVVLKQPFVENEKSLKYAVAPRQEEKVRQTFCGT